MPMAALTVFCRVLLDVLNAAALPDRRLLPVRRHGQLLRDDAAILMVLGASAIFHAVAAGPNNATEASRTLAAAGFLIWLAGVALLLLALTPGRFPPWAAATARFGSSTFAILMAAFTVFCRVLLLVLSAAALAHRRLLLPLRHRGRLLRDAAAIIMVLGASTIFHAVAAGPNDATEAIQALAAAGFLIWVAGVALLLLALTPARFPEAAAAPARFAAQLVQAAAGAFF